MRANPSPARSPAQTNSARFFSANSVSDLCALCVKSFLRLVGLKTCSSSPSLLKIKMPMPLAPRIKPRPASRAPRLAIQILPNRHLRPASPTQNRPLLPLPSRPNRNRMPRQRNMAILASPVDPATPHLDRHNIHRRAVMHASCLPINLDSAHLWTLFSENSELPSVTGGPRTEGSSLFSL